jgi:hypothetical protein
MGDFVFKSGRVKETSNSHFPGEDLCRGHGVALVDVLIWTSPMELCSLIIY